MSIHFDNFKILSGVYHQFDDTSIFELSEGDNLGNNDGFLMI